VLAVACDHRLLAAGDTYRADALLRRVPARAWQWVSAGRGAKGHRYYDWAFIQLDDGDPIPGGQAGRRWLLVRRNRKTGELAFYHCWTPRPVALATLVRVAGRRRRIKERFQTAKGLCGLDQHQVRRWRSWYRWTTLAMLAHAFLVVAALTERTRHPPPSGLISLTCNEVQHLFATLAARPEDPERRRTCPQSVSPSWPPLDHLARTRVSEAVSSASKAKPRSALGPCRNGRARA
jgi:hypothetical protein